MSTLRKLEPLLVYVAILVAEAYNWAFTRQNQYGYAAAYAVLIFLLLSGATRLQDRLSKRQAQRALALAARGEAA